LLNPSISLLARVTDPCMNMPMMPEPICPYKDLSKEDLIAIIKTLMTQNKALMERVAELERQLGLNSSNSSKPPSSEGLKQSPRTRSTRGKSERSGGGQKGHPGKTLRQKETPDEVIHHHAKVCVHCGASLDTEMSIRYRKRQVFDVIKPGTEVTEHRAYVGRCRVCGKETKAVFPKDIQAPVQYGKRMQSLAVYLQHGHFIPEDRLSALFDDVLGVPVCAATLAAMSTSVSKEFMPAVEKISGLITESKVKHLDETGFRIKGKTQWLHVQSTEKMTHYRISFKRGDIPRTLKGVVVHDHFKPYYTLEQVKHALCNAHHLRELQALVEIEKEPWAKRMQKLLRLSSKIADRYRRKGTEIPFSLRKSLQDAYNKVVSDGIQFHELQPALTRKEGARGRCAKRIGHNLLIRLHDRKEDVLRFLDNLQVPFTNNQAEQDIRMMKVKQKISGGFRSVEGAENFAIIRSILSTARKLGWNLLDTLAQTSEQILAQLASI
jgi:transposase